MKTRCSICYNNKNITLEEPRLSIHKCDSCFHTFTVVTPDMKIEKYDDDYFKKTHKAWFNNPNYGLFSFINNKILRAFGNNGFRMLDVGCGNGDFLKYIRNKNANAQLFGIDLVCNEYPGINFIKGSIYDMKKDDFGTGFDVICGLAVIEHVDDPNAFAQKINNLLKPGGLAFIMTVNNNSLMYNIAKFLNKIGFNIVYDRLYSIHHLQHYTNKSLRFLMENNGFNVLLQRNHNYPIKAVDVPESSFFIEKMYKFIIWIIFVISSIFGCGIYQTIMCKKNREV